MKLALALILSVVAGAFAMVATADASSVVGPREGCLQRASSSGAATNHAGLTVTFGDGTTLSFCIEFSEDTITGRELLQRSGLSVVTANSGGLGAAVCSIDGEGCNDPGNCFCQCAGGSCKYWVYYRYKDGAWQYSPIGAGTRIIRDGDADGWMFGGGSDTPPTSGDVCPDPTPTPTPPPPSPAPPPSAVPATEPTPTQVPMEVSPTTVIAAAPTAAVVTATDTPPVAVSGARPTSAVLSEGLKPPPGAATATAPSARSTTAAPTAARTPSPRIATGAIQVSDGQGRRNLAGEDTGGSWTWRGTALFGGVGVLLLGAGGAIAWRRRAGL